MNLHWILAVFIGLAIGLAQVSAQPPQPPQSAEKSAAPKASGIVIQGVPAYVPQPQMIIMFRPMAPDMCGPGFYCVNPNGVMYGPNYCVQPPFPPFNGLIPQPGCGNTGRPSQFPGMSFPTHPFSRSPRDFFMVD